MAKERFEMEFGSGDIFPERRKQIAEFIDRTIEEFVRHGNTPFAVEIIISSPPPPPSERRKGSQPSHR